MKQTNNNYIYHILRKASVSVALNFLTCKLVEFQLSEHSY